MPAGRQVGTWSRSLFPQLGEDRLLLLKTHFVGKSPLQGGIETCGKGSGGRRGMGTGDGACLRICLGSNTMGVSLGYTVPAPLKSFNPSKCNKDLMETSGQIWGGVTSLCE